MNVTSLITSAFGLASQRYPDLHRQWNQVSVRLGGLLPQSLLMAAIQRDGSLDLLLRCIEDDAATRMHAGQQLGFDTHYQRMLSELWIGSVYESLRLLANSSRRLAPDDDGFRALKYDLTLLRIPIEKHEIAGDRKLVEPIKLQRRPPHGDDSDICQYAKDDPQRAHIMPSGISARGSMMWHVLDIRRENEVRWIERRSLSERILELWGNHAAPRP